MEKNRLVTRGLCEPIAGWVNDNVNLLDASPNDHIGEVRGVYHLERKDTALVNAIFPYDELNKLEQEIMSLFSLSQDLEREQGHGIWLLYAKDYQCRPHGDKNHPDGRIHCRFNVMVSKPLIGGEPIISNQILPVEENEPWVCIAGLNTHYTVKMAGHKPRILISFGYYLDEQDLKKRGWI